MHKLYQQYLSILHDQGKYRRLVVDRQGQNQFLDFSTNDYLALSRHPDVIAASINAALTYGVGATGSRLLSGNSAR